MHTVTGQKSDKGSQESILCFISNSFIRHKISDKILLNDLISSVSSLLHEIIKYLLQ